MELYEVLFSTTAGDIDPEVDTLIRFYADSEDGGEYLEVVSIKSVDYDGRFVVVTGFSHVLNDSDVYFLGENQFVEILGG